jgi:hypothetical protein
LLESISQSLAGRAAIVYLLPLSYNEISKKLPVTGDPLGNPPQKQLPKRVEFSRNKEGDSINDNIKAQ